MNNYITKRIFVKRDAGIKNNWIDFLEKNMIKHENNTDYTIGIYEKDLLVGTGSLFLNIMKCIAVEPTHQGGRVMTKIITTLLSEISQRGYLSSYVYTKPDSLDSFLHLGFKEVARVEGILVLLEKAVYGFETFSENLKKYKTDKENVSAIVMNANPFTNGHKYLVDYASKRSNLVHVFVLSEDLSFFPTEIRLELVKEGTKEFENVIVHTTGDYMVSAKTFPSYFLKEDENVTETQAKLDANVFLKIAKVLGVKTRYVGEEPYSVATNIYNNAMTEVFKDKIHLEIIKRKEVGAEVISASRVRELIKTGNIIEIEKLVPKTTYDFISSSRFKEMRKIN